MATAAHRACRWSVKLRVYESCKALANSSNCLDVGRCSGQTGKQHAAHSPRGRPRSQALRSYVPARAISSQAGPATASTQQQEASALEERRASPHTASTSAPGTLQPDTVLSPVEVCRILRLPAEVSKRENCIFQRRRL